VGVGGHMGNFPPHSPVVPHSPWAGMARGQTKWCSHRITAVHPRRVRHRASTRSKADSLYHAPLLTEGRECERGTAQTLPGASLAI